MNVILLENIRKLGNLGDTVKVKPGYGRNYSVPFRKAVYATKENLASFEARRVQLEAKAKVILTHAQDKAKLINTAKIIINAQASDEGKLYGSIGVSDIKDALTKQNITVNKREIVMPNGVLHSVGEYTVEVHLHSDVIATLNIEIKAA